MLCLTAVLYYVLLCCNSKWCALLLCCAVNLWALLLRCAVKCCALRLSCFMFIWLLLLCCVLLGRVVLCYAALIYSATLQCYDVLLYCGVPSSAAITTVRGCCGVLLLFVFDTAVLCCHYILFRTAVLPLYSYRNCWAGMLFFLLVLLRFVTIICVQYCCAVRLLFLFGAPEVWYYYFCSVLLLLRILHLRWIQYN